MATAAEMLSEGMREEVWRKYCGFLDLSINKFMEIQERLLMEQIDLLSQCEIGKTFMRNYVPTSMADFRARVPLTTHKDYLPYFLRNPHAEPGVLPAEAVSWVRTSGRSSEYGFKWAPYSQEMVRKVGEFVVTCFILASCSGRGDVRLEPGDVTLYTLAPSPYFTGGVIARGFEQELDPLFIPSLELGDQMAFEERIKEGFRLGLKHGIDLFYGLSSVLVTIGEQFSRGSGTTQLSMDMLHPQIVARLLKGMVKSKIQRRPLLPKDLWKVKGIIAGGMDTSFYRDKIEEYWGVKPLEGYGGTEVGGVAVQTWNHKAMTFLPDCNFLEFIPEKEFYRAVEDPKFVPHPKTLDEVTPGIYEVVVTNLHGNAFVRYRTGDLIEIVSLRDEEQHIDIPQMTFYARADGIIDIGGFTRLTEKSVFTAIKSTGLPIEGWTARKEYKQNIPILHLYLESSNGYKTEDISQAVHSKLKEEDGGYADLETMLGINPLEVTMLKKGSFQNFMNIKRQAGAEMAHLKPPAVNPKDEEIKILMGR
jgi:GH3 auxin-responsive promoter